MIEQGSWVRIRIYVTEFLVFFLFINISKQRFWCRRSSHGVAGRRPTNTIFSQLRDTTAENRVGYSCLFQCVFFKGGGVSLIHAGRWHGGVERPGGEGENTLRGGAGEGEAGEEGKEAERDHWKRAHITQTHPLVVGRCRLNSACLPACLPACLAYLSWDRTGRVVFLSWVLRGNIERKAKKYSNDISPIASPPCCYAKSFLGCFAAAFLPVCWLHRP
ncbi:hypothetical protein F4802DRAFT_480806 [Xylaria palmicola]|nr:hypothetical protein F4802DRAFT_480806 [Xylaria palmicola]